MFKINCKKLILFSTFSVDCQWENWTKWSKCSATCGDGTREFVRKVRQRAINGGKKCDGASRKTENCAVDPCPGKRVFLCWGNIRHIFGNSFKRIKVRTSGKQGAPKMCPTCGTFVNSQKSKHELCTLISYDNIIT